MCLTAVENTEANICMFFFFFVIAELNLNQKLIHGISVILNSLPMFLPDFLVYSKILFLQLIKIVIDYSVFKIKALNY